MLKTTATAVFALMLVPSIAFGQAQTVGNENASTSAVILEGGEAPSDVLKTNPDASAATLMTTQGSCYVGEGSVGLGSYLFGGISGSKTKLDEGCEARRDSEQFANLAATHASLGGDPAKVQRLIQVAILRMGLTRDQYLEKAALANADSRAWVELFEFED